MRPRTALALLVPCVFVTAILLCQSLNWNGYGLRVLETKTLSSVSRMKNPLMWNDTTVGQVTSDVDVTQQPQSQHPPRSVWHVPLVERNVHPGSVNNDITEINRLNSAPIITILFWTLYGKKKPDKYGSGQTPFLRFQCPVNSCTISTKKSIVEEAEVVVFQKFTPDLSIPSVRYPRQRYISVRREAQNPESSFIIPRNMKSVFNVTITHRLDSDIPNPYGVIMARSSADPLPMAVDYASGKKKLVAWVVSHCNTFSKRERYVEELQKHIAVDVMGSCGPLECGKKRSDDNCFATMNITYKFYLSFENNLCHDYVTEKIYGILRMGGIIPIVLGGANYTKLLPPKSYIDITDFSSPKHLADYLLKLDKNNILYNSYFAWKQHYTVENVVPSFSGALFCRMCEYLQRTRNVRQTYTDIQTWWTQGSCLTWDVYYKGHADNLALQWRHNGHDIVTNHEPRDCLLNRLFRRRSKKTSKLRVTGLCAGKSPGPVNSQHKWPITRKMFPFEDVIMVWLRRRVTTYFF